jgi:2',3'-cyclic-nucleotide 2'-phosphodiesterase (5'-nucleotidase family)
MKSIIHLRQLLLLCALCLTASLFAVPITILHTNDTHGAYIPRAIKSGDKTAYLGGYETLDYYLKQERKNAPRSIYLDAGDQQTGSVFASMPYDGVIGGAVIKAFNMLELEATVFGNHEFDYSYENTIKLRELATYPFISTNLRSQNGTTLGNPYQIIKSDSLTIGIMGLTMTDLSERVKRENVKDIQIQPYKQALDVYLDKLDEETDLIILLTHLGHEADSLLATTLDNRVDLIIGGHSHVQIDEPWLVNGIYIASAGSHLEMLGKLELDVVADHIASIKTTLIPLWQPEVLPQTKLSKFVRTIADSLETELGKTIATIPVTWQPNKFEETALSRWMAEALKSEYQEAYKPDLAIINNGGLRKVIPAGPVTLKDMHELIPFGNYVVLFSCYGRDLLVMDELNKRIAQEKPYDIVQTSAKGWTEKPCPGGHGHQKPFYDIHGINLDPDKLYRVVSHDYLLGQWDKYLGFEPFDVQETGDLILDAMIRQVKLQYGNSKE